MNLPGLGVFLTGVVAVAVAVFLAVYCVVCTVLLVGLVL